MPEKQLRRWMDDGGAEHIENADAVRPLDEILEQRRLPDAAPASRSSEELCTARMRSTKSSSRVRSAKSSSRVRSGRRSSIAPGYFGSTSHRHQCGGMTRTAIPASQEILGLPS